MAAYDRNGQRCSSIYAAIEQAAVLGNETDFAQRFWDAIQDDELEPEELPLLIESLYDIDAITEEEMESFDFEEDTAEAQEKNLLASQSIYERVFGEDSTD